MQEKPLSFEELHIQEIREKGQWEIRSENQRAVPEWSIKPQSHEHAPDGRPPFDILFLPEQLRSVKPEDIFLNLEGRSRITDNTELETTIQTAINKKKESVDTFNEELVTRLRAEGKSEEDIQAQKKKFFDGKLVRLHPQDFGPGDSQLFLRLGETTYFTYAGTRKRENLEKYGYDRLGLPLAVCSVITAPSENGQTKILYTIRGTANESYPGWYHAVGGTVQTVQNGIANPTGALKREITEELGLTTSEFNVDGVAGLVMNNFDLHPELIYLASTSLPIEQWHQKRKTDKEVDAAFFTDTPENLEAFILGRSFNEVPDARPIVPSGLSGYLFYGRLKYGQEWYHKVLNQIPQY